MSYWKAGLLYSVVSFFLFFEMAIQVSPSVMSSQLMHDFQLGSFGLGLLSGIYFYSYTAMQIPSGLLFDRFNPRLLITFSILLCVVGTFLFALAQSVFAAALARLLMGCGSAFAFVSVLVVTADLFEAKYFATMTGITQMLAAFGAMSGQLPISALVMLKGWRDTLFILSGIGAVLAIIVWNILKYEKKRAVDLQSSIKITTQLKQILSQSQTWMIALYACLLWAPMSAFTSLWGVPYLTTNYQLNPSNAAFLCSLMWLGLAIASPILGSLSSRLANRVKPLIFSALIGAIAFSFILEFKLSQISLGICLFLSGAACAGQALSFTVVKEINHATSKGTAIAFNNMAVVISGAIFQPLIGKLIEGYTIQKGLWVVLLSYSIAFIIALFFINEPENNGL